jgi:RimJ/RimL family protein N-acetyltransferase
VQPRFELEWTTPVGALRAIEPTPDEVLAHARSLAIAYNEPRNAVLLGHTEALAEADVVEHYETLSARGGRLFVLYRDGTFHGDADLRGITRAAQPGRGSAEFAFLVASPDAQGKGLGTRFATMVHAFAFAELGIDRVYASVIPRNVASRRVFEKLGYAADDSPAAREFADDGDVTLSIDRAGFLRHAGPAVAEIRIAVRPAMR